LTAKRKSFIITIDGPAGSGKSTTAKLVAQSLGFLHLDTGAMYRAVTLAAIREKADFGNEKQIVEIAKKSKIDLRPQGSVLRVFLNKEEVTDAIRLPEVTEAIGPVAGNPDVREILVELQRTFAKGEGVVAEGRDIGTVVFPDADLKIYMVASLEERARRRQAEMAQNGIQICSDELMANIKRRDDDDSLREHSPLKKPEDALVLDTSGMSIEQQVDFVVDAARQRGAASL